MNDSIQFMEENRQGVTIVRLVNQRLLDPRLADELTRRLGALLEGGALAVLIDMGSVARMSSVFFRSFIMAGKKANEKKVKSAFYNLPPVIREGFVITGLDKLFKIYDSEGKGLVELEPG